MLAARSAFEDHMFVRVHLCMSALTPGHEFTIVMNNVNQHSCDKARSKLLPWHAVLQTAAQIYRPSVTREEGHFINYDRHWLLYHDA